MIQLKQMKNKSDNILLIVLWLTVSALGACFWLNIKFGFNMFSAQHWHYLSVMQASGQPINLWFYTSIAISIAITIAGLYIVIHPNFYKITKRRHSVQNASTKNVSAPKLLPAPIETPTHIDNERPRGPNQVPSTVPPMLKITEPIKNIPTNSFDVSPINTIFESAGYTIKNPPRINGTKLDLFAIGTDEVLWIGTHETSVQKMQEIVNKLHNVFTDTLEDIEITINAFVISASGDTVTGDILTFENTDKLSEYILARPNPPLPDNDDGNFDAYSEYMSTVTEYIGQV